MTRCSYVEPRLRALLDGELEPGEARKVLLHVETCAVCRDEHARLQALVGALQGLEHEDAPPHFGAELQVRLARHRRERARLLERRRRFALPFRLPAPPQPWRWVGGLGTAVAAGLALVILSQGISAAEVARRAGITWAQVRNYGCHFVSRGVYQGQIRSFTQRQFYRRPGDFRLDTGQDYPLSTFVYEDRIVHYLPGGDWKGVGPLVIVRPRVKGQDALPFPFGVTGQNGGNVSLDLLIRQLNENHDARVLGTEPVGDRECYRLQFTAVPPGGSRRDQYDLWVDRESFLPRRVSWYRDEQNHIVTEAEELQVNYEVLPTGTFDFAIPDGARVIEGDVDPHVFALPFQPSRGKLADEDPVAATREDAWLRHSSVSFPVLTPEWLPDGFKFVRARRKIGRWVDMYWVRDDVAPARVLKLVQEDARVERPESLEGREVNLGTRSHPVLARLFESKTPFRYLTLTWTAGRTRCTLSGAGLSAESAVRLARSLGVVTRPLPRVAVSPERTRRTRADGEPSFLPVEPEAAVETPTAPASEPDPAPPAESEPPMMPEMSDDDRVPATR